VGLSLHRRRREPEANMNEPLSPKTIDTVRATAPAIRAHGLAITSRMYERLFTDPRVKTMFEAAAGERGDAPDEQPRRLAAAILAYAEHVDRLETLAPAVAGVAARHVQCGVRPEQYALVAAALLPAIRDVLGAAATDEVLDAWSDAYGYLAELLIAREAALAAG
jgi:nitric oxide dioxygenase